MAKTNWARKAMVIGLDAPIPARVLKYVAEGKLPNLERLIAHGVWADNCMVPFPTITPPNWTAIATGAWTGTHGITGFSSYLPGDPLNVAHPAFTSEECQAEHVWTAAERAGKQSIVINYPTSWPPKLERGYQIGGAGIGVNEWRQRGEGPPTKFALCAEQAFCTQDYPLARQIELVPAVDWHHQPEGVNTLEAELPLQYRNAERMALRTWYLLLQNSRGQGYDRIYLSLSKDVAEAFAVLELGQWSPVVVQAFETEAGSRQGAFRCKLVELSPDAGEFRLYVTQICPLDGWSYPAALAGEISSGNGLPGSMGESIAYKLGWIDLGTYVELLEIGDTWLSDAAAYLVSNKDWSLFFMHLHTMDRFHHDLATQMDPLTAEDAGSVSRYQEAELHCYQVQDRVIGRLVELAGEDTLVVVTSDHGAKASGYAVDVGGILADAGLTVYQEPQAGRRTVDWSKTRALAQRACYIYVNLKGRDPDGIVEPGQEYEAVRDQVIAALYDYTDPVTGKKPFSLVLRREDARVLGLHGERIGDIVFALGNEWGGQHGNVLPTAQFGLGEVKGLLLMAGPGVKHGVRLERTVWSTDVVPTICYLTELPVPKDAEGGIMYQALENPNARLEELERLRKNYARVKGALEAERNLTHTYNM
jgi:predicted AlkP superfamily phosphohydrolase/phosphomutase